MKARIYGFWASLLMFLAWPPSFAVTFADNTFALSNYSGTALYNSNSEQADLFFGGQSGTLVFRASFRVPPNPEDAPPGTPPPPTVTVAIGLINNTFRYDPLSDGPILGVNAFVLKRVDSSLAEPFTNTFRPLIFQNGIYYIASIAGPTCDCASTGLQPISKALTAADFFSYDFSTGTFGTAHPNFGGAPLYFGIAQIAFANNIRTFVASYKDLRINLVQCIGTADWATPKLSCTAEQAKCTGVAGAPPGTSSACPLYRTAKDDAGRRFEVWCGNYVEKPKCEGCFGFYLRDRDGSLRTTGKCWFEGGINTSRIRYDDDGSGNPKCFAWSTWLNEQTIRSERDAPFPPRVDYTPADNKLDRWLYAHDVGARKTDIRVTKDNILAFAIDPPAGGFFNDLLPVLPDVPVDGRPKILRATRSACDLNDDGRCDAADRAIFATAMNSCAESREYLARADANGDGCINDRDFEALFVNAADANSDGKVDCADLKIVKSGFGRRVGQLEFDARADLNLDGVVDIRDLSIVSRQLPAGAQCR